MTNQLCICCLLFISFLLVYFTTELFNSLFVVLVLCHFNNILVIFFCYFHCCFQMFSPDQSCLDQLVILPSWTFVPAPDHLHQSKLLLNLSFFCYENKMLTRGVVRGMGQGGLRKFW